MKIQMTQTTLRKALGLLIALPMVLVGISAGTAFAGEAGGEPTVTIMDAGNKNATVTGVPFCSNINVNADCWTWESSTAVPCPNAHFCLYTNRHAAPGGKIFALYHCREYALQAWLDSGFVENNNTGGAAGFLRGSNHATLPGGFIVAHTGKFYNFYPVWFVKAC